MFISTLDDLNVLCKDEYEVVAYLQFKGIILDNKSCEKCLSKCAIYLEKNSYVFRCWKQRCNIKYSLNSNSWLARVKLSYCTILKVIYGFVHNIPVTQCALFFNISRQTLVDWYNFCREICINACFSKTQQIGGPGKVVEIHESKFGKRGHAVEHQWVFGGVERGNKGSCFLVPVACRDKNTLIKIVKEYILPGTTIIYNGWKAYTELKDEGFNHLIVNHSVNFKDPQPEEHTNTTEGQWFSVKRKVPLSGWTKKHFLGYLAAYMWTAAYSEEEIFEEFLAEVAKQFKPQSDMGESSAAKKEDSTMKTEVVFIKEEQTESVEDDLYDKRINEESLPDGETLLIKDGIVEEEFVKEEPDYFSDHEAEGGRHKQQEENVEKIFVEPDLNVSSFICNEAESTQGTQDTHTIDYLQPGIRMNVGEETLTSLQTYENDPVALRSRIVGLHEAGMSAANIAATVGVARKTVYKWIYRWVEEGSLAAGRRSGRPRVSDRTQDEKILQVAKENPFISSRSVIRQLNLECSRNTVLRRLKERGEISTRKQILSEANREMRLGFALQYSASDVEFWKKVVFSDEKLLSAEEQGVLQCLRRREQRYKTSHTGKVTVGAWGWMDSAGPGEMCKVEGRFNGQDYIEVLEDVFLPSYYAMREPAPEKIFFVHDNSLLHRWTVVRDFFAERQEFFLLDWPNEGNDLNPMENLWAEVVSEWSPREVCTTQKLFEHVSTVWEGIRRMPLFCERQVLTMPKRIRECVKANGGWTD